MNRRTTRKKLRRGKRCARKLTDRLNEIAHHCGSLPIRDPRSEDEILGYNADGMPE